MKPKDKCGVFAFASRDLNAAFRIKEGLYALQHRGQESAGISVFHENEIVLYKNFGLVQKVFDGNTLNKLKGFIGIGHVRYSTQGEKNAYDNIQPIYGYCKGRHLALVHNGNLTNTLKLKTVLIKSGKMLKGTGDSEVILHLYSQYLDMPVAERIKKLMSILKGAYSVIILDMDTLIGFRDPLGYRPLWIGRNGQSIGLSSEEGGLVASGLKPFREVMPGEVVIIENYGLKSTRLKKIRRTKQCIFELIYFSRPDGHIFGQSVYDFRKKSGILLGEKDKTPIDIVVAVPDSGTIAAIGYAQTRGLPLELGFIRNHYTGRSFIEPGNRKDKVRKKLIPVGDVVHGKKVALIDDSIVRGTTSREIIRLMRESGAREVHLRIASPPVRFPCYFGIDIPTRDELVASGISQEDVAKKLEADSVLYIEENELLFVMDKHFSDKFCTACFDGKYE